MASRRLPIILALEIESAGWQANSSVGDTQAYPRDEHCQSSVGSAADPWRTPQARHRYRTDQRGQVHGQAKRSAIPRLEDVPSQSCRWHRRDGSVRRTDNLISSTLRLVDCGAWSTADFMVWRHSASDRRMDRKLDHGSLRLGTSSHPGRTASPICPDLIYDRHKMSIRELRLKKRNHLSRESVSRNVMNFLLLNPVATRPRAEKRASKAQAYTASISD